MVSYRFCRPDDLPLLARAVNECFNIHFPGVRPLTAESLKAEVRALDVWPSNAMVGLEGDEPVAVMIGTKRPEEVLIYRVGVRPDYWRRGHALHLVTSLSQKLAVLGPSRLIAEVPAERPDLMAFVEAASYHAESSYQDWLLEKPPDVAPAPAELLVDLDASALDDLGLLPDNPGVSWARDRRSLLGGELSGLALAGAESIEAFILHQPAPPPELFEDLMALASGSQDGRAAHDPALLGPLLAALVSRIDRPLRLPRVAPTEYAPELLTALGFSPGPRYHLYVAEATPG